VGEGIPLGPGDKERMLRDLEEAEEADRATIKFKAHVWKVGTLGGAGGLRVSLDLDQAYIKQMAMLAECQHELIELEFVATARDS